MATINWDTTEFNKKMEEITENIIHNVEKSSREIISSVYADVRPVAPMWKGELYTSIGRESIPFRQITEKRLRLDLIYDAWNPRTGFHYAMLRHEKTTTGQKHWFRKTVKENEYLLIERPLTKAVQRSIR